MKILSWSLRSWFSIIEVMVGIFIFTLWLFSIYALLISALNVNEYNKNAIIASHLAREQMELFRNIRDTNYMKLKVWNQKNPNILYNNSQLFLSGSYYILENDFSTSTTFSTQVQDISSGFEEGEDKLSWSSMTSYRLCLDSQNLYTYTCTSGNTQTPFYRYLYIEQIMSPDFPYQDVYSITSKVIWNKRGYHEYDIKTIVTDWRRI
jgi:Tfp pilus assembly protein PilV